MTREDAINIMKVIVHMLEEKYDTDRVEDAVDMAIKALEQEPCDDAISREFMYKLGAKCIAVRNENDVLVAIASIESLPPVTPQPKTGMWIEHFDESGKWYECDQCHTDWGGPVNYCPNCGARMEGDKR